MWKMVLSYLPDWKVYIQGFIAFFIPLAISGFFKWVRASEEE